MNPALKAFYALCVVAAVMACSMHWFVLSHGGDTWRGAMLGAMVSGSAERPYVYRWLVPKLLSGADQLAPEAFRTSANESLALWRDQMAAQWPLPDRLHRAVSDKNSLFMRLCWWGVMVLSLAAMTISMHRLAQRQWPSVPQAPAMLVVIAWGLILALPAPVLYLYDPPALALSALGLYALAAGRWRLFVLAFALASFNKESSLVLLVMATWLAMRSEAAWPPRRWIVWLWGFWLIARAVPMVIFRDNPGLVFETQYWPYYLSHPEWLALLAAGCALLCAVVRRMNELLKASAGVITMMVVAYAAVGKPGELRVFYDVVPMMSLVIMQAVMNLAERLKKSRR
jgi:hypothetical protein